MGRLAEINKVIWEIEEKQAAHYTDYLKKITE
jgi:hypothetical protein